MTPQNISKKSLYLVKHNASAGSGVIATVPAQIKAERNIIRSYAIKHYSELCTSTDPMRVFVTECFLNSEPCSIVLGLARNISNFVYRQKFITLVYNSPITNPVDVELIII